MMVVKVAVPVLRGKLSVLLEKGRPWSLVEHLILEALSRSEFSATELAAQGQIPRRVVIESIIRLMRAGWVQLSKHENTMCFSATESGKEVAFFSELPNFPKRVRKSISFIVDQAVGQVFRNREWIVETEGVVRERTKNDTLVWIHPESEGLKIDPGAFTASLLEDDEKLIDAASAGVSRRFALLTVRGEIVEGLPDRELPELRKIVLQAAKSFPVSSKPEQKLYSVPGITAGSGKAETVDRRIHFDLKDLILDGEAHKKAILKVLHDAKSRIYIHSTFIGKDSFMGLLPHMEAAIKRGVQIHVLWGQNDDPEELISTRRAIGEIREDDRIRDVSGSLIIHPFSTKSHAKIIVADSKVDGRFVAFVGSCNWLSSGFHSYEASIRLSDPQIVADVVDNLARLVCAENGIWSELITEFVNLSKLLRKQPPTQPPNAVARLVIGPRHGDYILRARDEATSRVFLTSHRLGPTAYPSVFSAIGALAAKNGIMAELYFGRSTGAVKNRHTVQAINDAATSGVTLVPVSSPRLHAKILAWDSRSALLTSLNWLSGDPVDGVDVKELGVFIEADGVASKIIDNFECAKE
ncbi:hypothetical protein CR159_04650 [Pollutimonas subterranea]|uniref:PLD phosphodiesterase domain-containing protein n=1 Tax=Pollutimonas subterranea TaxID=2045210 RepID=A0A2N4U7D1_9BURK|nr:phospholipase D-like domain-containing protein [Pollutimonas subterranea]PLC50899.1 hypothetical protein CR159_04650 [Pollutimonas subterranea]